MDSLHLLLIIEHQQATSQTLYPDLSVTLPYYLTLWEATSVNEVWVIRLCIARKRSIPIFCEYQWAALLDLCLETTSMALFRCLRAARVDVSYSTLAQGNSAFHFLSSPLKIKMTDDCVQTLTGKAPQTDPVRALPRFCCTQILRCTGFFFM